MCEKDKENEKEHFKIDKKHFIFCEGSDAKNFFSEFLAHCKRHGEKQFDNEFQVANFGGNAELRTKLLVLSGSENFDELKSLLIIRDAETDFKRAIASIRGAIQNVNEKTGRKLPVPTTPCAWKKGETSVGFLLFPTCDGNPENGTLEDLCLELLREENVDDIMNDIDIFLTDLKEQRGRKFPQIHKTRLHTYFSVTKKFVTLKLGGAARKGAFNWEHEKMRSILDFLSEVL